MNPQEVSPNLGPVPRPPLKGGGSGTLGDPCGTGHGTTAGQPGAPNLKELANAALLRLGKRDTLRDNCGTKAGNSCPAPPQKKDPCGTTAGQPHRTPPTPAWDPETAALVEWFNRTLPPSEPFDLHQGVTVLRPGAFWQYLRDDIAGGPSMARGRTGALRKDLRRLAELFGGPAPLRQGER